VADDGCTFSWKVGKLVTDYTASQLGKEYPAVTTFRTSVTKFGLVVL
jgi:hypothetical protein